MFHDKYSRLRAIADYGFDIDFDKLKDLTVTICGVGGIGSLSAEMLARCGIGKLVLIDLDIVEENNLNRLFYRIEHIGRSKAEVCAEVLAKVNPDIRIKQHITDIMDLQFESTFEEIIESSDLIINGLDNIPARQYLNVKCVTANKPYMDAGVLRSGFGGYIHLVIPYVTACYQCTGSVKSSHLNNDVLGPPCAGSLPSTIAIISALQVQHALKYLLKFGSRADFISYNGLNDNFTLIKLEMDENCYVCGKGTIKSKNEFFTDIEKSKKDVEVLIKKLSEKES